MSRGPMRPLTPPEPPLTAGRILLRPFEPTDAAALAQACRDPAIPRFTFMPEYLTEQQARIWIEQAVDRWPRGSARFAVADAATEALLGQVGMAVSWPYVSAEAYYWLAAPARGRGVATTALGLLCDWAFDEVGVERLYALVHPDNAASHGVVARCGFTREGVLRAYQPFKGARPDMVSWSLLPGDARPWRARAG